MKALFKGDEMLNTENSRLLMIKREGCFAILISYLKKIFSLTAL